MSERFRTEEGTEIEKSSKGGILVRSRRGVTRHLEKEDLKVKHPDWDK